VCQLERGGLPRRQGSPESALSGLDWQYCDSAAAAWVPPVDIFEEPDAIRIVAEVPGVTPDNVKISLENNVLTVTLPKVERAKPRQIQVEVASK